MRPRVSIGLPVYNGRDGIADAIRSILGQSLSDFELIISDNASTDGTAEFCEEFAAADRRIRLVRQPRNIGALANFDQVFDLSSAPLFAWAACDDIRHPRFLAEALRRLEAEPSAVLAASDVAILDDETGARNPHRLTAGIAAPDAPARYRTLVCNGCWSALYGLMRRSAIRRCRRISTLPDAGRVGAGPDYMLVELCMRGTFAYIDEPLLQCRVRPPRTPEAMTRLLGGGDRPEPGRRFWYFFADLFRLSGRVRLPMRTRLLLQREYLHAARGTGTLHDYLVDGHGQAVRHAEARGDRLTAARLRLERALFIG